MSQPLPGCIADDFTGGTDLASMLVRGGMHTLQLIGIPQWPVGTEVDAVVIALKTRTLPPPKRSSNPLPRWACRTTSRVLFCCPMPPARHFGGPDFFFRALKMAPASRPV